MATMPLRVYLAAPYAARDQVRSYVSALNELGMACTASWLDEDHEINDSTTGAATALTDAQVSGHALDDLSDIDEADVLVLFTADWFGIAGNVSGGRHVETGYALAKGKYVIVVGEPENVFHRIQSGAVEVVPGWHQALLALQQFLIRQLRGRLGGVSGSPDVVAEQRAQIAAEYPSEPWRDPSKIRGDQA